MSAQSEPTSFDEETARYDETRRFIGEYLASPEFRTKMERYNAVLESLTAQEILFLATPNGKQLSEAFTAAHGHEPEMPEEVHEVLENARSQGLLNAKP